MRTLISRVLIVLAALTMLVIVPAGAAHAQWPDIPTGQDCLRPPDPESPTNGLAAMIDPGPAQPPAGDPFAPQSPATLYDTYGYAGFKGVVFDPGCVNTSQFFDGPNALADSLTGISVVATAISVRLARIVLDGTFGSIFKPLIEFTAATIGTKIFIPLMGVGLLATGLFFLARSRFGDVAGTAKQSAGTLLIICMGLACTSWAVTIGAAFDQGISSAFSLTNQALMVQGPKGAQRPAADAIGINLIDQTLYPMWAQKTMGNNPQAIQEFGPALFKAGALTRVEQQQINDHPETAKDLINKKKDQYKKVGKLIQNKYPQAYAQLAGNDTTPRVGWALLGLLGTGAAAALLMYSLLRILYSITVARLGIAVTPGLALVAQHPKMQHHAIGLLGWIAQCCISALIAGVLFVITLIGGIGGILAPHTDWHPIVKILALVMMTIVLWHLVQRLGLGEDFSFAKSLANKAQQRFRRTQRDAEQRAANSTAAETTTTLFPAPAVASGYAPAASTVPPTLTATLTPVGTDKDAAPGAGTGALPNSPVLTGTVLPAAPTRPALESVPAKTATIEAQPVQLPGAGQPVALPSAATPRKALTAPETIAENLHSPVAPPTPTPGGATVTATATPDAAHVAESVCPAPITTTSTTGTKKVIVPDPALIYTHHSEDTDRVAA